MGTFDFISGTPGHDHLVGTAVDDFFDVSQGGRDTVIGKGGDDIVRFGAEFTPDDKVDGGRDNFATTFGGDQVLLSGDYSAGLVLNADTITNVEVLDLEGTDFGGGSYSITLDDGNIAAGGFLEIFGDQSSTGTDHFNIDGSAETDGDLFVATFGKGNDRIVGGDGNDYFNGGNGGADVLNGGGGWNRVSFSRAGGVTVSLRLQGSAQDVGAGRMVVLKHMQGLSGSTANDTLTGDIRANYVASNGGSDTMRGGGGDDGLLVSANFNVNPYSLVVDGGAGHDTVFFSAFTGTGVTFSLALQGVTQSFGNNGSVNAAHVENAGGTALADTLAGDTKDNSLYGDAGDDALRGAGGNDFLYGDRAFSLLVSDAAGLGATGVGSFVRGEGADVLQGGRGDDYLDGGDGIDTGDYSDATDGVHVDLSIAGAQFVGGGRGTDILVSIENLSGSALDDTLGGDAHENTLAGGEGADTLNGRARSDLLFGGEDGDTLNGGSGGDVAYGGEDGDTLNGGNGEDVLYGDAPTALVVSGFTELSTNGDGIGANGFSLRPSLSADGNLVAFESAANNLVDGDDDGFEDIFVKNLTTGEVVRVSPPADGSSFDNNAFRASISPDGTKVVWVSAASNLVPNDTNNNFDVFMTDLTSDTVTRISTGDAGEQANGESAHPVFTPDGHHVVFSSWAANLDGDTDDIFNVFIKDLDTGDVTLVSEAMDATPGGGSVPNISSDGTMVVFRSAFGDLVPDDTNGDSDFFVKDLASGVTTRVSTASDGTEGDADVTGEAVFSFDGGKVTFASYASNLGVGDAGGAAQVYVKDLATGKLVCVSTSADGTLGDFDSGGAIFSHSGRYVAFSSDADNLVADDTNGTGDVFLKDLITDAIVRITLPNGGELSSGTFSAFTFSQDDSTLYVGSASFELPGWNDSAQIYAVQLTMLGGSGGDDTLNGGSGDDILIGGAGADVVDGGAGADVFQYGLADESTSTGFDTVIGFDATEDRFDVAGPVTGVDASVAGGELSDATFDSDLAGSVGAAELGAHHAVVYTPATGDHAGQQFLIIDANGDAGYQAGEDYVVRMDGGDLGALGTEDFI